MPETHAEHMERARAAYREAHARLVKRLTEAPAAAVERAPEGGGWSAAQIGWHVAAVDASFAGLLTGERPGAKPLADGVAERPWSEIAATMPGRIEAGSRVQPPAAVTREEVLALLADASVKLDAALAGLDAERGAQYAITHPALGTITLRQFGDWAAGHVIRHNAQAKRALGG
jgi:DinB superfamily